MPRVGTLKAQPREPQQRAGRTVVTGTEAEGLPRLSGGAGTRTHVCLAPQPAVLGLGCTQQWEQPLAEDLLLGNSVGHASPWLCWEKQEKPSFQTPAPDCGELGQKMGFKTQPPIHGLPHPGQTHLSPPVPPTATQAQTETSPMDAQVTETNNNHSQFFEGSLNTNTLNASFHFISEQAWEGR